MPSVSGMEELLGVHVPPPRESFEIREVHVSSALRRDPLPGIDYSFNPYIGCYHGCTFCYVPRLLQIDRNTWGASVVVKRNAATVLAKEVRRLPRGLVAISTATDPYQFVEGKYRITRHALEVLQRAQWPVSVLSRAPLMIRDIDLFTQFREIDAGLMTFVGFAPAYPPTGGWSPNEIAEVFAEAGVKKMFTRALDPRWGVPEAIAKRLEGSDLAPDLLRL